MQKIDTTVSSDDQGLSLAQFLKKRFNISSATQARKLIAQRLVEVNQALETFPTFRLAEGDKVTLCQGVAKETSQTAPQVLHEEAGFLILDKPAGLASCPKALGFPDYQLVHRLDKDSIGLLILAKRGKERRHFENQFRSHRVKKTYFALVHGRPANYVGCIERPVMRAYKSEGKVLWSVADKGKGLEATTYYELLKTGAKYSLLACYPKTGRTHQIRVHLSSMGHPIVGDRDYGSCQTGAESGWSHHCLWAKHLSFIHPSTQRRFEIESELKPGFAHDPSLFNC